MPEPSAVALVIDDEPHIRRFLRAGFEIDGLMVIDAENAAEGLKLATLKSPDVIVLDLVLPDMDGSTVIERVRAWSQVPIVVISVRAEEEEIVRVLELGADDYLVKPFGMPQMLARIHAVLRRRVRQVTGEPIVKAGPLAIDLVARNVTLSGKTIDLTRREYQLLEILAQHAGKVVTQQQLLREVWGTNDLEMAQYLRILVHKLRHKIEIDPARPRLVVTMLGVGYRLQTEPETQGHRSI